MARQDLESAYAAMRRLAPRLWETHREKFTVDITGEAADGYRFAADGERLSLSGNDIGSVLTGFRHYLESSHLGHISRGGDRFTVPETLPLPERPVSRTSPHRFRYATNFTVTGYTSPYWQWPRWERELDLLAASGINLSLVTVGTDAVWLDTFGEFGFDEKTLLSWIAPPAHNPFHQMGCMCGFGGVSRRLVEERAELGRRITDRMRELGIEPVLPGFAGLVPGDIGDTAAIPQGQWFGFDRPAWLPTTTRAYAEVAEVFYAKQTERLGATRAQAVDLLHEGGTSGGVDLADATRGIAAAMERAHDDYLWVLQAWWDNPLPEVLAATDSDHLLLLDLTGEGWRKTKGWHGKPWARGSLTNFGGRTVLFGGLPEIAELPSLKDDPKASSLVGTALVEEAWQVNPVVWSLFTQTSWADGDIDLNAWVPEYVAARYGKAHPRAVRAWHGLLATAYRSMDGRPGGAESLLCAMPSLDADRASMNGPHSLPYPAEALEVAWRDLLAAREALGGADTFRFDLVDVTRQVISNRARPLLPLLRTAYAMKELDRFIALSHSFIDLFELLDPVLATREEFLVGRWLADARALAADEDEADALEFDARTIITTWGDSPESSATLIDYANHEWAGLIADYYRPRWEKYLKSLETELREGKPAEPIDFYADAAAWARSHDTYPTEPSGDAVSSCRAVHHALPYFEGLP
ncbi:alpha-N-acetylglucosaminidase [Stackebrandtia nassauensis]|uniref:Alpha-N-acetylglucosaminidase n=1 Tax=Stackebrandtia nassauensis (strain DSM 44728 / CIP 108903 / NRRL B-16338 / NBRC 102104 / LLR-40K-21) TaxID=446470 RepID=D3QAN4_STANL|nr:alpha-N-acetylglucosaminidase [Stackebrandtia nassauensis]ADD44680.1 Alpha-N-acetylglucosaminidase [Stackebrandtia nassauensis DSM 44728]